MPRNAEVIRQWTILRDIETSRTGLSIAELARRARVTTRTIRRDLDALQQVGFPLYDEKVDGRGCWRLGGQPFKGLETGFTIAELSALYFSRTLVECLAGTPFQEDLQQAFDKIEKVLTPRVRQFLDRLPRVLGAKAGPARKRLDRAQHDIIARLTDATLHERRVTMQYHSLSSNRTKRYSVDPYRVVYAQGGLYLFAYVPEYREMRTFAVERILSLALLDEHFTPIRDLAGDLFAHSLGTHEGRPERVKVEFAPEVAQYVKNRVWHTSQVCRERTDGSVILELEVSRDWALRSWILSFGPFARVVAPSALAEQILKEIDGARRQYGADLATDPPRVP